VADYTGGKAWPINNLKTSPTLGTAVTGVGNPQGIAITPDGNTGLGGGLYGWQSLADQQFERPHPLWGTAVSGMTANGVQGIAITPDGNTAWVADANGKAWPINNLKTSPTLGTAVTGVENLQGIAITPDGNTAWVADASGKAWPINNIKTTPTLGTAVTGMTSNGPHGIALTPDATPPGWRTIRWQSLADQQFEDLTHFGHRGHRMTNNGPRGIAIAPVGVNYTVTSRDFQWPDLPGFSRQYHRQLDGRCRTGGLHLTGSTASDFNGTHSPAHPPASI